jgi:hypothetical protein
MRLNFFKCYWLPLFPPTPGQLKRQAVPHASAAERRLMQATEQLGSVNQMGEFWCFFILTS